MKRNRKCSLTQTEEHRVLLALLLIAPWEDLSVTALRTFTSSCVSGIGMLGGLVAVSRL